MLYLNSQILGEEGGGRGLLVVLRRVLVSWLDVPYTVAKSRIILIIHFIYYFM